ncbi:MAG TPA: hypothetical protein VMW75_01210 [Thermoanaerobaculia bacterium]|nr:hypothetical protein [Thermoanaerobaculia bacterium]
MRNSTCWRSAVAGSVLAVTILAVAILAMTVVVSPAAAAASGPGAESTPEKPGTAAIMAEHSPRPKAVTPAKAATAHQLAFRNAVVPPPPGWTGPVFHLSHNYPQQEPGPCPKQVCKWLDVDVDFSTDLNGPAPVWNAAWAKYLSDVLDYVKEGQDAELRNEIGWRVKVGRETRWFHVPWMAYDPTQGREFVHGMTNERTARLEDFHGGAEGFAAHLLQLAPKDVEQLGAEGRSHLVRGNLEGGKYGFETWAFGMYNQWGGWSVGQAWPPDGRPASVAKGGQTFTAGMPFPEGTVVAKLLFTTATPEEVPYLKGSPAWTVDRHEQTPEGAYECKHAPRPVHLVQMDVAVVDPRSPTRWVYGTFAYYADYGSGGTAWDHLAPVGLQWGMDEWTYPAVPKGVSIAAHQSVLRDPDDKRQHFGCEHRLAGPVDNKLSSCLSCHGGGYAQPTGQIASYGSNLPSIFGFTGLCTNYSQLNVNYFQTTQFPMAYSGGNYPYAMSLDTSLQLQVAAMQYGDYYVNGKPNACTNPNQIKP